MATSDDDDKKPVPTQWLVEWMRFLGSRELAYGILMVAIIFCVLSSLFVRLFVDVRASVRPATSSIGLDVTSPLKTPSSSPGSVTGSSMRDFRGMGLSKELVAELRKHRMTPEQLKQLTLDELNNELMTTLPATVYDKAKLRQLWHQRDSDSSKDGL